MHWKKRVLQIVWILAGLGLFILLGAAMQKKSKKQCTDVKIEIVGAEKDMFIDENDVMAILNKQGNIIGKQTNTVNLRTMEEGLEKNPWVRNAEIFFDNNQVLEILIEERQPIARIFTVQGSSFYIDSSGLRLPLSEKLTAKVPVFTSFPSDKETLSIPDSAMLQGVLTVGKYIMADSFWMAQVAQVDITPQATFELVPVIGSETVSIGTADNLEGKFNRLYTFYKKAWQQNGINTYERLDVRYEGQVVAVRKGASKAWADSAKAKELLQSMTANGGIMNDSAQLVSASLNLKNTKKDSVAGVKPIKSPINAKKLNTNNTAYNKGKKNSLSVNQQSQSAPKGNVTPKAVMKKGNKK